MYSEEHHVCHDNSSKGTISTASPSAKVSSAWRAIYAMARDYAVCHVASVIPRDIRGGYCCSVTHYVTSGW
jgi:hypothetical protein